MTLHCNWPIAADRTGPLQTPDAVTICRYSAPQPLPYLVPSSVRRRLSPRAVVLWPESRRHCSPGCRYPTHADPSTVQSVADRRHQPHWIAEGLAAAARPDQVTVSHPKARPANKSARQPGSAAVSKRDSCTVGQAVSTSSHLASSTSHLGTSS